MSHQKVVVVVVAAIVALICLDQSFSLSCTDFKNVFFLSFGSSAVAQTR